MSSDLPHYCRYCKETKSSSDFPVNCSYKAGISNKCKKCYNKYMRDRYKNPSAINKKRKRDRNYNRAARYGLSYEEAKELRNSNNGLCHCCNISTATSIDHCHKTNRVRGHLCNNCNSGIGFFKDSPELLKFAIDYLRRTTPS